MRKNKVGFHICKVHDIIKIEFWFTSVLKKKRDYLNNSNICENGLICI